MLLSRKCVVSVRAESSAPPPNKVNVYRKKVESQRTSMLKENLNKLGVIANADVKFLQDTFTELDKLHKEWFDKNFKRTDKVSKEDDGDTMFLKE